MPGSTHWVKHYTPLLCLLVFPVLAFSQSRTLTGKVTSGKDNQPIASVSIQLKGKSAGTATGDNGEYSITVTPSDTIIASSVGYHRFEAAVKDLTTLDIVLEEADNALADVVVVGYGTQKKGDLTGSLSSVNSKDFKSLPVPNAGDAIQGRAAGVQVVSSGAPGSNATIRIRGTGTINNNDPLLVIDGVLTDVPLNTISPDDIETIDILKDASAAAIYGSRGANGVVQITTKRGKAGMARLDLKAFYGVQKATSMVEMLNASQFASLHNEMMSNNGQAQNPAFANPPSLGAGTNWLDLLFRTAPMQNYSLSFSGGTPKSTYYVSGTVLDQDGIVINTGYKRYTLQFNYDSKVFDWLRFGNNLTLSHDLKNNGSYDIRNTMAALPTQAVYNADGTYAGPVGQPAWVGDVANPIGKATLNTSKTAGYNILGNVFAELTLFKDLKFKTTGGVQAMFWDSRNWSPKYNWQPIPQPNSSLSQQSNKSLTWLWDNYFTYEKSISGGHKLTALLGTSAQTNRYDFINGSIQQFASNATQQLNNGTLDPTVGGSGSEWALLSYIGRINYAYKSKYLLTATIRRDGSSRFGDNNKYGTFPSASAAWRISEEDFFKEITFFNDLKIRAGYGITGNQNIGNYSFASSLQTVQYNFNGIPVNAIVPQAIPNPSVRWEEMKMANLGIDATILRNRVNITLDAYVKNTRDMLVPMSVPISTGYSDIVVPSINLGHMQNRGIELGINSRNITGDFEWTTSFNISYNQNKVISLNDSIPMHVGSIGLNQFLAIQHPGGYPVNEFYGFVSSGVFQNQKEVDNWAVQVPGSDANNRTSPGDVKFRDLNNDGIINDDDRTFIGNPNPSFIFAMNNNFAYKGFDLSIFLQGIAGNDIYNANRIWQEGMAVAQNQTTAVLDRWRGEGTSNSMPRAVFNDPNKNTRVSDRFVEDGSYLRIKNITLGYTLPRNLAQKAKMSSLRVYISGQNLATFTKYNGFDPEVPSNGIDLNVYPVTRTISAGINCSF